MPQALPRRTDPPAPIVPGTCAWAQDGLARAQQGMKAVSKGVIGYGVGSRHVKFKTAAEQAEAIDYWQRQVEFYCGIPMPPPEVTGRDTAFRVIPRDV